MLKLNRKKLFIPIILLLFSTIIFAQDSNLLMKEAQNMELKFDEQGALEKYKQVATNDSSNIQALVKCAELNCSIGNRLKDKKAKAVYFDAAENFAQQAYQKDSSNTNACYAKALVATRMSEIEDDNKTLIEDIKQIKIFSDKALAADINNGNANYILGKWHFELIHSNWLKKVKNFYNGIFDTQVDSAIYYMERCRTIEPYYALNYLDLANVYIYDHQPAKAIEVLNKLVKLPNRTFDDAAIKEEGKQLLSGMQ
ncbi:MAG: hypothetical protein ABJB05_06585 [Parafilimonas sp.]